ncbi:MAG: DUF6776 family protein [Steroidobacterales bacterium]
MAVDPHKLVVRSYAPRRRAVLLAGGVALFLVLVYGAFELGRYDAGFRVVDSVRGALSTSARIRELETENAQQRTELEAAEVARRVDREGYKQVERSLGDMQSQIARLNQDLSFYRGLVQPDASVGVKVQQMQIVPETTAGQFRLKFILMQVGGKPKSSVTGSIAVTIDGLQGGKPLSLGLAQVGADPHASRAYTFRYFEDYDELVHLPAGFEPTRVGIEIHSGRDTTHGFRQAFVWKAQGMSMETDPAGGDPTKGALDVRAQTQ